MIYDGNQTWCMSFKSECSNSTRKLWSRKYYCPQWRRWYGELSLRNYYVFSILKYKLLFTQQAIAIGDKAFIFDKIFDCNASQEKIYNETVKPFVQKVLTGYSCTCLAYGQTGTGKTYTMLGKNKVS